MYSTGWTGRNCDHDIDECNSKMFVAAVTVQTLLVVFIVPARLLYTV